jgi:23S rRNA pseudouridine1911/1915/1917 synthase
VEAAGKVLFAQWRSENGLSMAEESHTLRVEQSLPNERLDVFLKEQFPEISRGTLQKLIDTGDIRVNGQAVKPTYAPKLKDVITLHWPEPKKLEVAPEAIPLEILYEDTDLVVVNKPAGLVVHPGAGNYEHTLVNALLHHCAGQLSGIAGYARPGIVHRLDKDTSGCLVIAKNDRAHLGLSEQFQARTVEKIYHAVVCGELPRDSGEIRATISRHQSHRQKMTAGTAHGRAAHTSYRVLERLRFTTLVEVALHTGRTHQIRVHFQHLGYPLIGDTVYGGKENVRLRTQTNYMAPRQMLHSHALTFRHPCSGKTINARAPWPEDFKITVTRLRHPVKPAALP